MSVQKKKNMKIRYDRIAIVAVIFIILIVLLASCINSCSKTDDKKDSSSTISSSSQKSDDSKSDSDKSTDTDSTVDENSSVSTAETEYTTLSAIPNDVFSGNLVVVNKDHEYQFPASDEDGNGNLTTIYSEKTESYQAKDMEIMLQKDVITQLNSMMDAFNEKQNNTDIMVISAYRTKEYQDSLYNAGSSDIKGGFSDYHTGLSFDLGIFPAGQNSYYYTNEGDYAWIAENCANYGFVIRYPDGKDDKTGYEANGHQFRFVGIPHATYMTENNLCLEEYVDMLKDYAYGEQTLPVTANDQKYEVYYVPSNSSGNTDIPVPSNKDYTVSGNNIDGFIVTVTL